MLAIINIIEIIAIALILKRNEDNKNRKNKINAYSFVGMPTLLATKVAPGHITIVVMLALSAVILAVVIYNLYSKGNQSKQKVRDEEMVCNAKGNNRFDDAKCNNGGSLATTVATPFDYKLKDIISTAHTVNVTKKVINKATIIDFLEKTYGNKVETHSKINYTSTGLPLADTHYVVLGKKKTCFAFVYELDGGKTVLLLKTSKNIAHTIKESHPNIIKSRFPKSTRGQWYSLIVDDTFEDDKELFDILSKVIDNIKR